MSRKLTFSVTIEFTDKISSDDDVMEIRDNILRAIVDEADRGLGIAPDGSDTSTKVVTVKPQFLDEEISKTLF